MFSDLNKMLNNSADLLKSQLQGIPTPNKNNDNNPFVSHTFKSKVFLIAEDVSASEYAEFVTEALRNPHKYVLVREKENWTQNGECIRIIDYLEKEMD